MRQKYTRLRLILGDQLNHNHFWFKRQDDDILYLMMEVRQETDYVKHHIQKVCGFFLAMRQFASSLKSAGHHVHYITLDNPENDQTIEGNIRRLISCYPIVKFEYILPDEYRLFQYMDSLAVNIGVEVSHYESEHFLLPYSELKNWFKEGNSGMMEHFYRKMRRKFGCLMDKTTHDPIGGKWNFDHLNRNKLPLDKPIPSRYFPSNDVKEIYEMVRRSGVPTIGNISPENFIWPVNRNQSLIVLKDFLEIGLAEFGNYQDAMTDRDPFLFHSRLSFALNTKMLHPKEVIDGAIDKWKESKGTIDIAQVEGFVRQILGWREFVRGIYWANMPGYAIKNKLQHKEKLPEWYWTGRTKMACMSVAINHSLNYAYAHHIQRLMLTGNFALLLGVNPDEVDAWYLGIYIDAIEWVEMPNTRGMSQYADGGIVGTKPYISSANYIHKMSDHCKSCHYNHKDRTGDLACPFNSLFWEFYMRHEDLFRNNQRVSMAYRHLDKMSGEDKELILSKATAIRADINNV